MIKNYTKLIFCPSSLTSITIPKSVKYINNMALPKGIIIKGYKGSYAEAWANGQRDNKFICLDEEEGIMTGDVNGDSKITLSDAQIVLG